MKSKYTAAIAALIAALAVILIWQKPFRAANAPGAAPPPTGGTATTGSATTAASPSGVPAASTAGGVTAGSTGGQTRKPRARGALRYGTELNLTDDQKNKLQSAYDDSLAQSRAVAADKSLQPADRNTKLRAIQQTLQETVSKTLTPDQQKKLQGLRSGQRVQAEVQYNLVRLDRATKLKGDQKARIKTLLEDAARKSDELSQDQTLDVKSRMKQYQTLQHDREAAINQVLTPDQQKAWAAFQQQDLIDQQTNGTLSALTSMLKLTPEEQTKIRPILEDNSKQMQAIQSDEKLDKTARKTRMLELQTSTRAKIQPLLNADQAKQLADLVAGKSPAAK